MKMVFTSCMNAEQDSLQEVWNQIAEEVPDVLMLLGDQIYMDWGDLGASKWLRKLRPELAAGQMGGLKSFAADMHQRYAAQWAVPAFRALLAAFTGRGPDRLLVIWDDHDFAWNNSVSFDNPSLPEAYEHGVPVQVKAALDELRMVVDAMQPAHGDIGTVLATLRYRLQDRMQAAGIAVDWQVDELPAWECLTMERVLHLQRIILEAFTNVLRHSGADRLAVVCTERPGDPPELELVVEDNGHGLPGEGARRGQGLANMAARASAIGARLQVGSLPGRGTRVHLRLPLDRGPARSAPD